MWIVSVLLILAAWTALGFAAALLFFRLGFGFETRRSGAVPASPMPQRERERRTAGDRRPVLTPFGRAARASVAHDGRVREQLTHGRLERAKPVKVAG